MNDNVFVMCIIGKRVQETICLGASVVLIAFNFGCLYIHFESSSAYSIIAAACKYKYCLHVCLSVYLFVCHLTSKIQYC